MLFSFEQVAYTKLAYLLTFLISGRLYYKLFKAVITLLAAYFSMILTQLRQQRCNYGYKKFYNIGNSAKTKFLSKSFIGSVPNVVRNLVVEDVEEVVGLPGVADEAGVVEGGQEPVGNVLKLFFVVDDSAAA